MPHRIYQNLRMGTDLHIGITSSMDNFNDSLKYLKNAWFDFGDKMFEPPIPSIEVALRDALGIPEGVQL